MEELVDLVLQIPLPARVGRGPARPRRNAFTFFNDEQFRERYRFDKETVRFILRQIRGRIVDPRNKRGLPLSPMDQLLVFLRFCATGCFQIVAGDLINIHRSTVCRIIWRVARAIASLRNQYINMPQTDREVQQTKVDFFHIAQFPNVIGAIDCTHVKIKSPGGRNAEMFRNRKGVFSINVQAVCNAHLEILEVTARWPGSVHDSTIFQTSDIRVDFDSRRYPGSFLLGDRGYACNSYLLTPLANPQTPAERRYNKSQIKTRNTIERCFGVWKSRFPCLQYVLRNKVERSVVIITATAILHNIAVRRNLPEFEYREVPQNEIIIEGPQNGRDMTSVRAALIDTVFR